ncbi:BH3 interacting domain death agonist [Lates calcarifer]|uniref:BH3-interacting domain death agonist n=1 Tax=Lates calcarifer TaxID=8187 RepID=A0A4W6BTM2_LATCA|nr:BH3 interacting domain death agonist [Lates calcarifer]
MGDYCNVTGGQNAALVILAFLQADNRNSEYSKELLSLGQELSLTRDINCNGPRIDCLDDGDLETDGHLPSNISVSLNDIQPLVALQRPRNLEDAAAFHVAEELREIAAQLERNVVAQATRHLTRGISASPSDTWKSLITLEVERVMRQCVGLEHLPQERVFMALTLTLVKGVCEQAPHFLRKLFNTALQYINPARAR